MRLNHNIRVQIVAGAMRKLYERNQTLIDEGAHLARDCYEIALTLEQREAAKVLGKIGWVRSPSNIIAFNVAGQLASFEYHKKHQDAMPLYLPTSHYTGAPIGKAIADEGKNKSLVRLVRDWQDQVEKHKALCKNTEKSLDVLVKSVSSTETLFKVWPEGKQFYTSPPLPDVPYKLPAVQMQELNAALGLHA